jgi:hypothetical protein
MLTPATRPRLLLPTHAFEFFRALFDGHEFSAHLVSLRHSLGERVLELGPLLHRALASVIAFGFVYSHCRLQKRFKPRISGLVPEKVLRCSRR